MKEQRKRQIRQVAYLYYIKGLSQDQISKELTIYRTTVSRMLMEARKNGLVQVKILDFDEELFQLERYVLEKYQLKGIQILSHEENEKSDRFEKRFYKSAASYVATLISKNEKIGLSWGESIHSTIEKMDARYLKESQVVPLAGGPSKSKMHYHVNGLIYEMAKILHGKANYINTTVIQEKPQIVKEIVHSPDFKPILDSWKSITLAVMGIGGSLKQTKSQWRDLLSESDVDELTEKGAVGDICCRFVDKTGRPIHSSLEDRTIAIKLEQLTRVPKKIGIAYGPEKVVAILACLRANYINYLVTDDVTIQAILATDGDSYFKSIK